MERLKEMAWRVFASTGDIGSYLNYREIEKCGTQQEKQESDGSSDSNGKDGAAGLR